MLALILVASLVFVAARFSARDTLRVVRTHDGKTVEGCGWTHDVGQKRVMDILLSRSGGRPWRATKLDYPDTEMVWRYTQPETNMHAAYERRNTDDLNRVYYDLTVFP